MTDIVDRLTRSRMMAGIGPKDTAPEMTVRRLLHRSGFRYSLHKKILSSKPDLVLTKHGVAVFVHGCFWHRHSGCHYVKMPKTNPSFWKEKLRRNVERDARNERSLLEAGWRVLVVWECAVRDRNGSHISRLAKRLSAWVRSDQKKKQFPRTV